MLQIISNSTEETKKIGHTLAKYLNKDSIVILCGSLGAGKTAFVSGVISFFDNYNSSSSPTFTIVNEHNLKNNLKLFHLDLYRLESEGEFFAIGGDEFFGNGICLIEWGDKFPSILPPEYLKIEFEKDNMDTNKRNIVFTPIGNRYITIVKEMFN